MVDAVKAHMIKKLIYVSCSTEEEMIGRDPEKMLRYVTDNLTKNFPPEFINVVDNTDLSTLSWAPLMYRVPWNVIIGPTHKGSVTVAGDAFHPMTPDLGQGGGAALEDAVVLARNIAGALDSDGTISVKRVEKSIEEYVRERRWRAAGLITGAYFSGWAQQGGRGGLLGWVVNWFRDYVFYKFVQPKIVDAVRYDCGLLPSAA